MIFLQKYKIRPISVNASMKDVFGVEVDTDNIIIIKCFLDIGRKNLHLILRKLLPLNLTRLSCF